MPSKSKDQHNFMAAACNDAEFAKKAKIDKDVACDYYNADKQSGKEFKEEEVTDVVDTVTMDIPLFIRMLEFAKEDAADDMALHVVTEKVIELSKDHSLTMADYDSIVMGAMTTKSEAINSIKESIIKNSKYKK